MRVQICAHWSDDMWTVMKLLDAFSLKKGGKMSPIIFLLRYKLIGAIFKCFSFPPPRNVRNTCDTSASQKKWADRKHFLVHKFKWTRVEQSGEKSKTKDDKGSGGITTNDSMRRNEKMSHSPGWSKCAKEDAKDPHHHKEGGRWHCFLPLFYYIYTLASVMCVGCAIFTDPNPPVKILCSPRPCPLVRWLRSLLTPLQAQFPSYFECQHLEQDVPSQRYSKSIKLQTSD